MKKYILAALALALGLGLATYSAPQKEKKSEVDSRSGAFHTQIPLKISSTTVTAYVSDTPELRTQGLSGFSPLKPTEAMLFIFEQEGMWDFWMKDMLFSLDMIWVDASKTIVGIEKNISPKTFPKSFSAGAKSQYVIEVLAGVSDSIGLKIGDKVSF